MYQNSSWWKSIQEAMPKPLKNVTNNQHQFRILHYQKVKNFRWIDEKNMNELSTQRNSHANK